MSITWDIYKIEKDKSEFCWNVSSTFSMVVRVKCLFFDNYSKFSKLLNVLFPIIQVTPQCPSST